MFEESKKLYDNAVSRDEALSLIENQRSGDESSHTWRNVLIGLSAVAVFVIFIMSR